MSPTATVWPFRASASAIARPMPRLPPLTSATRLMALSNHLPRARRRMGGPTGHGHAPDQLPGSHRSRDGAARADRRGPRRGDQRGDPHHRGVRAARGRHEAVPPDGQPRGRPLHHPVVPRGPLALVSGAACDVHRADRADGPDTAGCDVRGARADGVDGAPWDRHCDSCERPPRPPGGRDRDARRRARHGGDADGDRHAPPLQAAHAGRVPAAQQPRAARRRRGVPARFLGRG